MNTPQVSANSIALTSLRKRIAGCLIFSLPALAGGHLWLREWWGTANAYRWLTWTSAAWIYLLWRAWDELEANHRPGDETLLPALGIANGVTLGRGFLMACLAGLIFSPRPEVLGGWLPGLLYTAAALPDYIDGYLARVSGQVTRLGESLDMSVDSLGLLVACLLAAQYGQVPAWFVLVGLARYLFIAALWLRKRLDKPVHELPYSNRRRGFAALITGFTFVMLWPLFSPPGTHIAAAAFGLPFLAGFAWDTLIASGAIPPDSGDRFPAVKSFLLNWLPVVLRAAALILGVASLLPPTLVGTSAAPPAPVYLLALDGLVLILLGLGAFGRTAALAGLISLGIHQTVQNAVRWTHPSAVQGNLAPLHGLGPLNPLQNTLIVIYTALLFMGTGALSLWPWEDRLITRRAGEGKR